MRLNLVNAANEVKSMALKIEANLNAFWEQGQGQCILGTSLRAVHQGN
jgi:hypothetical protein